MAKKNEMSTVSDARAALASAGKKLEKALGGEERGLALRAVRVADKCLSFSEEELDKYVDPKRREDSLLSSPKEVSAAFKDARDVLNLFAGILKKTEEAERDIEREDLHRRTVAALEAIAPPAPIPIIGDPEADESSH